MVSLSTRSRSPTLSPPRVDGSTGGVPASSTSIVTSAARGVAEQAREPAGPGVELRLGHEGPTALDADHLAVVLEDRQRLADNDAADRIAARQLGLRGEPVTGLPGPDSICSLTSSWSR